MLGKTNNLKLNSLTAIIAVIVCPAPLLEGAIENTDTIKWVLLNSNLFYINTQQIFISPEAQIHCLVKGMRYIIHPQEMADVTTKIINRNAGDLNGYWTLQKEFHLGKVAERYQCAALGANGTIIDVCTALKGMICKTEIVGAMLQYKNGTRIDVDVNDVTRYCDPQSSEYDELLDLCLIKFTQLLL